MLSLVALVVGCRPASSRPLELDVQFTCDIRGRLVPCGCFTGQFGGMTRLKTVLDSMPRESALRVDVGDAIGGQDDYHVIEYRYILRAFADLGYTAVNVGQREARLPRQVLQELAKEAPVPILSANLIDNGTQQPLLAPWHVIERAGRRIGVAGVVDPRGLDEALDPALAVEPMASALARVLPQLRKRADILILLAFTDEASLEALAREFYEFDLVLGGKVRQPSQDLKRVNRSLIYFTTNESRALAHLRLLWRGDPRPEVIEHGIVLLHDRIPEAQEFQLLAQAYRDEIRHTRLDLDDPAYLAADQIPGVQVTAAYVGSEACLECHPSAAQVWRESGHARAFATLQAKNADADPKCIGCHTVGFGTPSGYQRNLQGARLVDVGCESCHGPGSLHLLVVEDSGQTDFKFRPLGAGDCQACHYGEFSRPFDWETFWPPIAHNLEPESTSNVDNVER